MGTAIGRMTSEPAPKTHIFGSGPPRITATVIAMGRIHKAAPSTIASASVLDIVETPLVLAVVEGLRRPGARVPVWTSLKRSGRRPSSACRRTSAGSAGCCSRSRRPWRCRSTFRCPAGPLWPAPAPGRRISASCAPPRCHPTQRLFRRRRGGRGQGRGQIVFREDRSKFLRHGLQFRRASAACRIISARPSSTCRDQWLSM